MSIPGVDSTSAEWEAFVCQSSAPPPMTQSSVAEGQGDFYVEGVDYEANSSSVDGSGNIPICKPFVSGNMVYPCGEAALPLNQNLNFAEYYQSMPNDLKIFMAPAYLLALNSQAPVTLRITRVAPVTTNGVTSPPQYIFNLSAKPEITPIEGAGGGGNTPSPGDSGEMVMGRARVGMLGGAVALVAFDHYILGTMVEKGWIMPEAREGAFLTSAFLLFGSLSAAGMLPKGGFVGGLRAMPLIAGFQFVSALLLIKVFGMDPNNRGTTYMSIGLGLTPFVLARSVPALSQAMSAMVGAEAVELAGLSMGARAAYLGLWAVEMIGFAALFLALPSVRDFAETLPMSINGQLKTDYQKAEWRLNRAARDMYLRSKLSIMDYSNGADTCDGILGTLGCMFDNSVGTVVEWTHALRAQGERVLSSVGLSDQNFEKNWTEDVELNRIRLVQTTKGMGEFLEGNLLRIVFENTRSGADDSTLSTYQSDATQSTTQDPTQQLRYVDWKTVETRLKRLYGRHAKTIKPGYSLLKKLTGHRQPRFLRLTGLIGEKGQIKDFRGLREYVQERINHRIEKLDKQQLREAIEQGFVRIDEYGRRQHLAPSTPAQMEYLATRGLKLNAALLQLHSLRRAVNDSPRY